ncbi:MAG: universal stress protein [Rhodobacterales bacterium]|nr:universal stress protein [Rhodobacterales bacterium]
MAYKTLLTVLTDPASVAPALNAAAGLARAMDAHLDVLSLGIDRTQVGYSYIGGAAVLTAASLERAEADARGLDAAVRETLGREEVRWSSEAAVAQLGALAGLVAQRARFADLVVLPRPYGKGKGAEDEAVVESALFEGQAPVLVLPEGGMKPEVGRRIVVAWNQSREAMRAVRAALPMLIAADRVCITVIDPPQHGPERSDPGGALSAMLVRHGVKAEISVLARTLPRISDVLVRHIRDIDADLLVMGAYGHSRLTEALMGGATRNMLEEAPVPVLLAH